MLYADGVGDEMVAIVDDDAIVARAVFNVEVDDLAAATAGEVGAADVAVVVVVAVVVEVEVAAGAAVEGRGL